MGAAARNAAADHMPGPRRSGLTCTRKRVARLLRLVDVAASRAEPVSALRVNASAESTNCWVAVTIGFKDCFLFSPHPRMLWNRVLSVL
mmetsp:Transcript_20089/g.34603  ORF Transcript_20089/g.34603 Transcript_20089/m.34603 type:complete len:89 (-) Transcript_20089:256-522(-)